MTSTRPEAPAIAGEIADAATNLRNVIASAQVVIGLRTRLAVAAQRLEAAAYAAAEQRAAEAGLAVVDPEDLEAALTAKGPLPDALYDRLAAAAGVTR